LKGVNGLAETIIPEIKLLIITGMSGAGKSQAINVLEDLGYYCIDNIPPLFIPKFAELCTQAGSVTKAALVVDIRGGGFFSVFDKVLEEMLISKRAFELLYLEATDAVLIRRYKETRRSHPLSRNGRIEDGIALERQQLEKIRAYATNVIDTSELSTSKFKEKLVALYGDKSQDDTMAVTVLSFGFKYGIPLDADNVFDVRFLPNPYYQENLRMKTGLDTEVADYVWKWPKTQQFLHKLYDMLDFLVPSYVQEGKGQLVIAIGCTGGMHRSVFIAEKVFELVKSRGYKAEIVHRDAERNLLDLRRRHN
jgi:UPF0042 nucleotide-binding protein